MGISSERCVRSRKCGAIRSEIRPLDMQVLFALILGRMLNVSLFDSDDSVDHMPL